MTISRFGPWVFEHDPKETAKNYEATISAAESCMCPGCANYQAVRQDHFPESFTRFLLAMGVDHFKELSVRRVAPLDAGHSLYAGSFGVAGAILEGPGDENVNGLRLDVFEEVSPKVHVALRSWPNPPGPWAADRCVRIRFLMILPWQGEDPSAPVELGSCRGPSDRAQG